MSIRDNAEVCLKMSPSESGIPQVLLGDAEVEMTEEGLFTKKSPLDVVCVIQL